MRATRWTRKSRVTKPGRGGWQIGRHNITYTNPVTGDSQTYITGGRGRNHVIGLRWVLAARRENEFQRVCLSARG